MREEVRPFSEGRKSCHLWIDRIGKGGKATALNLWNRGGRSKMQEGL